MDLHLLTILLPAALCQIQPDVRFDGENDRFDLSALMRDGAYDQWENIADGSRRADGGGCDICCIRCGSGGPDRLNMASNTQEHTKRKHSVTPVPTTKSTFDMRQFAAQSADLYNKLNEKLSGPNSASDAEVTNATARFMDALREFQQNFEYNATEHFSDESEDPNEKLQLRRDLATYIYSNQPNLETRRSGQTEAEEDRLLLMQHAVPITFQVEGIMQLPVGDE